MVRVLGLRLYLALYKHDVGDLELDQEPALDCSLGSTGHPLQVGLIGGITQLHRTLTFHHP